MVYVNEQGYLERSTHMGAPHSQPSRRNWWLIKGGGLVNINCIIFEKEDVGKRVRFKIEFI